MLTIIVSLGKLSKTIKTLLLRGNSTITKRETLEYQLESSNTDKATQVKHTTKHYNIIKLVYSYKQIGRLIYIRKSEHILF